MKLTPIHMKASGKHQANDSLKQAQELAMQGVRNQNFKFQIIAENIANSESTASKPGEDPYQRKQVVFGVKPGNRDTNLVEVQKVIPDKSEFRKEYDPGHPAADEDGYIKKPNVDRVIETVDMMATKNTQKSLLKIHAESTKMRRMQINDLLR